MSCDHIEYSLYKVFDFELVFICEKHFRSFFVLRPHEAPLFAKVPEWGLRRIESSWPVINDGEEG